MPNSEYDNAHFFEEYAKMFRSQQGLPGAGEWRQFQQLFPDFSQGFHIAHFSDGPQNGQEYQRSRHSC